MPAADTPARRHGKALYDALRGRRTIRPLIEQDPSLTIDDAYEIGRAHV